MRRHSGEAVLAAERVDHLVLDRTEASIEVVERILDGFRRDGTQPEDIAETLISIGAYVGELLAQEHGARWVSGEAWGGIGRSWPVMALAGDRIVDPIGEVFSWVGEGSAGSALRGYLAMTDPA
jgi:hypothetical protein